MQFVPVGINPHRECALVFGGAKGDGHFERVPLLILSGNGGEREVCLESDSIVKNIEYLTRYVFGEFVWANVKA